MVSVWKSIAVCLFVICGFYSALPQNDERWLEIDDFGQVSNDDLMGRVDRFYETLEKRDDTAGLVLLYGPRPIQHINQRRIQGCFRWAQRSPDRIQFVVGPEQHPTGVQVKLLLVAKDAKITFDEPDYRLPDLKKPLELSSAFSTDEYCPRYFDLDWFAHFMNANSSSRGKVVIDSTAKEFVRRVTKYREELKDLGVVPSRVRFSRRHFIHERDEQWWLIPAKRN